MSRATASGLRYHQVYSVIRGWIFDGTYAPGSKLPPEGELCERFGVSRITSRKAIDLLVAEGLLTRAQGKGTYVADDIGKAPNIGDMDQLIRKTTRLAQKSKVIDVKLREIVADEDIARDLDLRKGSKVRELSFVRTMDGKATGCRVSYLPLDVMPELDPEEVKSEPMLAVLERHGVEVSGARQLIGACLADPQKATLLNTYRRCSLVRICLIVLDTDGRAVERSTAFYLADRYEHHVYLTRSKKNDTLGGL
ncbi:MAG: GntR family transcriptional regulator [Hyphomonadaceae bacterium]